jgi:ABC-type phosphate transport system, ATPase component
MLDITIHKETPNIKIAARNLNFFYGSHQALFENNLEIPENRITAVIGPSGCGKSTHLRVYNRIFELYREQRCEGEVLIDGVNVLDRNVDVLELRRKVGMIFQRPTPFPMSVFDNVAYGMRLHFKFKKSELAERVESALRGASLWDEVKASSTEADFRFPADSSSGSASREPSPRSPKFSCWMSRPPQSIPSPR